VHTEGRRAKKYCSDKCRISHHNKQKKEPKFVQLATFKKLESELLALKEEKNSSLINETPDNGAFEGILPAIKKQDKPNTDYHPTVEEFNKLVDSTVRPKSYDDFLKEAKSGVKDLSAFEKEVTASKLTPNQKSMVLSKIKK